ncbi:phage major capsid protein [Mobiluncus mulieris]|uniref:Phage major capsid protein n=1 Tax=Mobiluncus mulieris TaxID=2052 RepID=A0A7Y0Y522_9ACTO|nr:phage major capsid protein [Mobiluncus mulieris]NMW65988.1 phage major capsid protein [Mobiluncus mulieris]
MQTLKEQRGELLRKLASFQARIKAGETLTDEETSAVKALLADLDKISSAIKDAEEKKTLLDRLSAATTNNDDDEEDGTPGGSDEPKARTMGQFFLQTERKAGVAGLSKSGQKLVLNFKAATDPQSVGTAWQPLLTDVDKQPLTPWQRKLTIASLMSQRVVQGNSIEYFLMGAMEGKPGTVAESGKKPQIHYADPTPKTETLRELAAHVVVTDDMLEDLNYIAQLIDDDLRYQLMLEEENQLLAGDGQGTNLTGLLNRQGLQVLQATAKDFPDKLAEAKFAIEKATEGGARADAIVMHPDDYLALLLTKDGNQQYYGGGFFQNAYGQGSLAGNPAVWLLPTLTTTAVAKGTALVGAFKTAKVLRKGSIQRAVGFIDQQFIHDQSTIRLKERVGLMVDRPEAFVKVAIGG